MKKIRKYIIDFKKLFAPVLLDEVIAHDAEQAIIVIQQTEHTIRTQQYLRHMAKCKLKATLEFRSGNIK